MERNLSEKELISKFWAEKPELAKEITDRIQQVIFKFFHHFSFGILLFTVIEYQEHDFIRLKIIEFQMLCTIYPLQEQLWARLLTRI